MWNIAQSWDIGKHLKIPNGHHCKRLSLGCDGSRIVHVGSDFFIRVWDKTSERHICCVKSTASHFQKFDVTFTTDGHFFIYVNNSVGEAKIWRTDTQELVVHGSDSAVCPQGLSANEAVLQLRNCGPKSSQMWPKSWGRSDYAPFMEGNDNEMRRMYIVESAADHLVPVEKQLLGILCPVHVDNRWQFSRFQGIFVTTERGLSLICRLVQ